MKSGSNYTPSSSAMVRLFFGPWIGWNIFLKRVTDIFVSILLIILFFPLMLLVAIAVKLTSRGPILYVPEMVGRHQKPFRMYKFRSMVANAHLKQETLHNSKNTLFFKLKNDFRITPLGRFIRKFSIDELPQLFNVLKGDMSLVGPRPLSFHELNRFERWGQLRRFSVKPGLTCIWQINGRSNTSDSDRMKFDLDYVAKWFWGFDIVILLKTIPIVLLGKGAH